MVKYFLFYLLFISFIVNNVESGRFRERIRERIRNKKQITTEAPKTVFGNTLLQNNPVTIIQDLWTTSKLRNLIANRVALNCFGIPDKIYTTIAGMVFRQTEEAKNLRFYFYSRHQEPVTLFARTEDFDLGKINFSTQRKTVVIVHGFLSSGTQDWVKNMTQAFLEMDDLNVIVVDWQDGSNTWNYFIASIITRRVGEEFAMLLYKIKQKAKAAKVSSENFGKVHFVGHSLGSHISAYASYLIRKFEQNDSLKWTVERITGLDPAQPCFNVANLTLRLDKSDALYVDVIHTNARHLLLLGFGIPEPLGHMDFYPNGGQIQLGCDDIKPTLWHKLMLPLHIIMMAICSHGRAHELLTDSIRVKISGACTYEGHSWNKKYENLTELLKKPCDGTCPELGINSINYYDGRKNNVYFVPSADQPHYCKVTDKHRSEIVEQLRRDEMATKGNVIGLALNRVGRLMG